MEGKECKDREISKMRIKKSMQQRGRCFSMGKATLFGPVAVDGERFVADSEKFSEEKGVQKNK